MPELSPQQLNSLYVPLHRSLLQYVGECWPWSDEGSDDGASARAVLSHAVKIQRKSADELANHLEAVDWVVDHGSYPTAYTDLHYVSLTYLLKQVAISENEIIKAFDAAASANPDSPLLQQIADSERAIRQSIQQLTAPKLAVASAG